MPDLIVGLTALTVASFFTDRSNAANSSKPQLSLTVTAPGRVTDVQLLPRKTGVFRGPCAEFCGIQHTLMALDVTVESKADFHRWHEAQLKTAPPPATPQQLAGYRHFTTRECSSCHNIGGTGRGKRKGARKAPFSIGWWSRGGSNP